MSWKAVVPVKAHPWKMSSKVAAGVADWGMLMSNVKRGGRVEEGERFTQDMAEHEKPENNRFFQFLFQKTTYSFQILMGKRGHPWGNLQAAWDIQQRWSIYGGVKKKKNNFFSAPSLYASHCNTWVLTQTSFFWRLLAPAEITATPLKRMWDKPGGPLCVHVLSFI